MSVGVMKDRKLKSEGSTRLTYTGLRGELEHLKIKTRLIDERFASVMGVSPCVDRILIVDEESISVTKD